MPQPQADHAPPAVQLSANNLGVAGDNRAGPAAPPPHLLWETLETAFAAPDDSPPAADKQRLAYIGLPMALGLSLVLWVVIVELVLRR